MHNPWRFDSITKYTVYSKVVNVTDDPKSIENIDLTLEDCNIHVMQNDIKYGNGDLQEAVASANSVLTFKKLNLRHFFVKNATAGSNAKLAIVGTMGRDDGL